MFDYSDRVNKSKLKIANKMYQDSSMIKTRRDTQLDLVMEAGTVGNLISMFTDDDKYIN